MNKTKQEPKIKQSLSPVPPVIKTSSSSRPLSRRLSRSSQTSSSTSAAETTQPRRGRSSQRQEKLDPRPDFIICVHPKPNCLCVRRTRSQDKFRSASRDKSSEKRTVLRKENSEKLLKLPEFGQTRLSRSANTSRQSSSTTTMMKKTRQGQSKSLSSISRQEKNVIKNVYELVSCLQSSFIYFPNHIYCLKASAQNSKEYFSRVTENEYYSRVWETLVGDAVNKVYNHKSPTVRYPFALK